MFVNILSRALLLTSLLAQVAHSATCTLSEPIALGSEGNVELQQYVDTEANTFTIKVTYTGGLAFIGVGLNDNGDGLMTPSNAVVGDATYGVVQYRMTAEAVNVAESQTLLDSSFEQTDDTTVLTFTQSLDDITDRDLTEPSTWIYAIGYDDNTGFVGHSQQGSVEFALTDSCEYSVEDFLSEPIALGSEGNVELQQYLDIEEGTFTVKVTYTGGQAFVGVALNDNGVGEMTPSNAIVGDATYGVVQYRMTAEAVTVAENQTLLNSSFVQTDDTSVLTFTQSLADITDRDLTDVSTWIYAIGYDDNTGFIGHSQRGSVDFALTDGSSDEPEEECSLETIALGSAGNVELEQYVDLDANTFTMKVTYTGGQAFVGVALNDNGTGEMTPANAVIGDSSAGVMQYRMTADAGVVLAESQTLLNSSFVQTDDTSVLTFTQSLDDITDRDLTDPSTWIYAIGYNGNTPFIGHSQRESFEIALTECGITQDGGTTSTEAPTTTPNDGGSVVVNEDCAFSTPIDLEEDLQMEHFVVDGTLTMRLTYTGGQSWIGIGTNDNGEPRMTPSSVVIGRGDEGTVGEYRLTSYFGASAVSTDAFIGGSIEQTDDTTVVTFVQWLNGTDGRTITNESQWIYAVGREDNSWSGHSIQGSFQVSLVNCGDTDTGSVITIVELGEPNKALWMVHGIMLAVAWGLCAPIGIGASLIRDGFDRLGFAKGTWYTIHFYMNAATIFLTLIGFVIALVAMAQQYESNATHFEGTHEKMGLAIAILAFMQGIGGYMRPGLPKKDENGDLPPKTTVRVGFEIGHRVVGGALLAMAWYNCHTGIQLSNLILEDYPDWRIAFWIIVGVLGGIIMVTRIGLQTTSA
eukprot:Nitzschia sp. Nitz4//scaffold265_size26576//15572//18151//NITZ4_008250-RA/size26576-processed-gene-0.16-mRNA-1//-1//CDS//3329544846//5291//frame0